MELAFFTLLLKDGANSISRGVAIYDEWVLETRLSEDRGGTNGIYERLKGAFVFVVPMKFATFRAECDEGVEGSSQ